MVEANRVCSGLELWPKVRSKMTSFPKLQRLGKFQKALEGDWTRLKNVDGFYNIVGKLTYCY